MAKKDIPTLAEFAKSVEAQAMAAGISVCQITHPDAVTGTIHQGTASGIRLVKGDAVEAILSNGKVM